MSYLQVPGSKTVVKVPPNATPQQLAVLHRKVDWLAHHNGRPYPPELQRDMIAAKVWNTENKAVLNRMSSTNYFRTMP